MPHHRCAPAAPPMAARPGPARTVFRVLCGAALVAAALLYWANAHATAPKLTERTRQKRAAESERAELRQKLANLKRDIDRTETAKERAADSLAESEAAISDANRALRDLNDERTATEAKLAQLSKAQSELAATVDAQQKQLSRLLRDQYVSGNEDRVKLLLSGDNPNRINRELQYMGYVSQAQAALLASLRANLQAVERNKADIQEAKDALDEIAQEAVASKAVLEKEKVRRAMLLAQLSTRLASQRKEVGNLQRDEQRLAGLVDKLSKLIEEQQKAEAAAREQRRQEQLAKARREQEQRQAAARAKNGGNGGNAKPVNPDAIDDDEPPPKALARNELAPNAGVQEGNFPRAFSALRGQLRLPVKGELLAKFGSKRSDGPTWKGLFIRAAEGADIKAVAGGRVIFADWLRGFGNLVIVDHGSQYLTIYGNNQAILKHAGDAVKTGDVIASAGNSGGNEQSGLYFEMRHQGRVLDPLEWVTLR